MSPIIIPMNTRREVNCIIQDNVRYCENNPITKREGASVAFIIAGVILWLILWFWLSEKIEDKYNIDTIVSVLIGGLVLPAIIVGLVLMR